MNTTHGHLFDPAEYEPNGPSRRRARPLRAERARIDDDPRWRIRAHSAKRPDEVAHLVIGEPNTLGVSVFMCNVSGRALDLPTSALQACPKCLSARGRREVWRA